MDWNYDPEVNSSGAYDATVIKINAFNVVEELYRFQVYHKPHLCCIGCLLLMLDPRFCGHTTFRECGPDRPALDMRLKAM